MVELTLVKLPQVGQTFDPCLAWKKVDVFKINGGDVTISHKNVPMNDNTDVRLSMDVKERHIKKSSAHGMIIKAP